MLRDEALLFGRVTLRLTSTGIVAHRPHFRQVVCFPDFIQCVYEFVHHFRGVVWSGCNPQTFLTAGDGRVIDGLHIDVVVFHEIVGNLRALLRIANLERRLEELRLQYTLHCYSLSLYLV